MGPSVRSRLITGVAALAATVLAFPPSVPASPPTPTSAQVRHVAATPTPRIDLAASVRALVASPPDPARLTAARAALQRIDPVAAAAVTARQRALVAAAPVATNAVSDGITGAYQFIQSWVDYGVQLATYALQFVPYGYLISGQVNIFYYNLIRPISDSVVYGLINPVLNDPLNPASYVNGLITVGRTTVNALINTGIAEFNYFFGWLIPPLPPLPLAAARTLAPQVATALTAAGEPAATTTAEHAALADTGASAEKTVDAKVGATNVEKVDATGGTTTDAPVAAVPTVDTGTAVEEPATPAAAETATDVDAAAPPVKAPEGQPTATPSDDATTADAPTATTPDTENPGATPAATKTVTKKNVTKKVVTKKTVTKKDGTKEDAEKPAATTTEHDGTTAGKPDKPADKPDKPAGDGA